MPTTKLTRIGDAVDLPAMLASIDAKRRAYRADALQRHGFPETVACVECGDLGTQPTGRACWCGVGRVVAEAAERERDWEERVRARVRGFRSETVPDRDAADRLRAWIDRKGWERAENVVLMGKPGTGKTGLGVATLRWAFEMGVPVAMVNIAEWIELMRPTEDKQRQAEQEQVTRRAMRARLLLLDDLGAERATEWTTSKVYALINHRYEAQLATIATTNATRKELNATYGERVVDRLFERADAVVMDGANLRRQGA